MSHIFLQLSFFHFLSILFVLILFLTVRLLALLSHPKLLCLLRLKAFFLFLLGLHKFSCDKIIFQQNLYFNYVAFSAVYHDIRENRSQTKLIF